MSKTVELKEVLEVLNNINNKDCRVGYTFFDDTFFGRELQRESDNKYDKGYELGRKELLSEKKIEKISMSGMVKSFNNIYPELLKIKKTLYYEGYGLNDAPFHGWTGESLARLYDILGESEKKIDELIEIFQIGLGLKLDKDAWRELDKE